MSIFEINEPNISLNEAMVRIFIQTPNLQEQWKLAQQTYGRSMFPDLHVLARQLIIRKPEIQLEWQRRKKIYGNKFYPNLTFS